MAESSAEPVLSAAEAERATALLTPTRLPAAVAAAAVAAYQGCLQDAGIDLGPDWAAVMAAALAAFVVARGPMMAAALDQDRTWGTMTARPGC